MARWKGLTRGVALAAAATLALAACSSNGSGDGDATTEESTEETTDEGESTSESGDALFLGSLLPTTGSLAFLGPPEIAGVDLAVNEINEAGGIFGADVAVQHEDSSDTDNPQIGSQSVTTLLNAGVDVIIGAASSGVTLNVIDDVVNSGTVMFSPANTATTLSGYSPLFFRTSPPDTVQGNALANLMLADGHESIGILVFNEDYGTSLRDVVVSTVEAEGGAITYGFPGEEFDTNAPGFSSEVQAVLATNPDAITVIAFDQTISVLSELISAGFAPENIYLVDGNTSDYSEDFDPGTLEGAQGTIPGAFPAEDFQARMNEAWGSTLNSFAYGPESYDAALLVALAALKGGSPDSQVIADNLPAVSGTTGGQECTGWVECKDLIEAGEEISYQSASGVGPFNEANDPSSAYIGVYEYDGNNVPVWVDAVYGEVPQG